MQDKEEGNTEVEGSSKDTENVFRQRMNRRKAVSKAASVGAGVAVIVAGVGGYLAGSQSVPAAKVEKVVTRTQTVEKTVEKVVTVTTTAGPAVPARTPATPAVGKGVLKLRLDQSFQSLDPAFYTLFHHSIAMRQFYDSLVDFKPGAWPELEPSLAEKWEVSKDGRSFTFFLKKGVSFQKGFGEVTSEDVKFSIGRIVDPNTKSGQAAWFAPVLKDIEILDKYTVRFNLKIGDPAFIYRIAPIRVGFILSKKAVEKFGKDYGQSPETTVGSGRYEVVEYVPKERFVLKRNENYWGKKPLLERIEILTIIDESTAVLSLQKGEINFSLVRAPENVPKVRGDPNLNAYKGTSGSPLWMIGINHAFPPFKDIRVRQALAHALDLDLIVKQVAGDVGVRGCGFLAPGAYLGALGCADLPKYPYDVAKAKQLLADAGYKDGLKIQYAEFAVKPHQDFPPVIQSYWKAIGVETEIALYPPSEFIAKITGATPPAFDYSWGTRPPEPSLFLRVAFHSKSVLPAYSMNYTGVDDLIDKASESTNEAERVELYKRIQRKIVEDVVIIPLGYEAFNVATRKNVTLGRGAIGGSLTNPYWHYYWMEEYNVE